MEQRHYCGKMFGLEINLWLIETLLSNKFVNVKQARVASWEFFQFREDFI